MFRHSLLVFLLLSSSLVQVSQGIRLEKEFMQFMNQNGGFGEVVLCKEGHCKGIGRKLLTLTTSSSTIATTSKNDKTGENYKPASKGLSNDVITGGGEEKFRVNTSSPETSYKHDHQEVTGHDNYVDIMDYSPARRKPPIHN